MAHNEQNGASRSLAIYGLLLELYPRPYLHQHRAEMLQNFQDLETTTLSKSALWLFIGRDLAVSLRSQFTKTLWGQTAIVFMVLALLLVHRERHPGLHEHRLWGFCYGYALGWFAGWFGKRWQSSPVSRVPNAIRSFSGQAAIILVIPVLAKGAAAFFPGIEESFIWALSFGSVLGWIAGWVGYRWQTRP